MPEGKYRIHATIQMGTNVEPDGYFDYSYSDAEDFEDQSSWYGEDIAVEGEVSFVVSAETEDDAREKADSVLGDVSFAERGDLGWEIGDYSINDIECIEEPMDMARAKSLILAF